MYGPYLSPGNIKSMQWLNEAAEECMSLNAPPTQVIKLCREIYQIWEQSSKNQIFFNLSFPARENSQPYTLLDRLEALQNFDQISEEIDYYLRCTIEFVKEQGGKNF